MIHCRDFSFQYTNSNRFALQNINLTIPKGSFTGITGASGAGKTTLAHALSGVIPHHYKGDYYGCVTIDGLDTVETPLEVLSRHVGSVFSDVDAQMVSSVVEDEILFGLENFGTPQGELENRLNSALEMAGIQNLRSRSIASLSGGQKQKVAVCAVCALQPDILVLDEPTAELDPQSSRMIFEMLQKLNQECGTTIVVVEQKIMLLSEFCQHLVVLDGGTVLLKGTVREVLSHSAQLKEAGVNCPRVCDLADQMNQLGLYHGDTPVTIAEAEQMVRCILNG